MKRHHDHGNSYKEKYLNGACLEFRGSALYHPGGMWWLADQHGAGEVAETSTCYR